MSKESCNLIGAATIVTTAQYYAYTTQRVALHCLYPIPSTLHFCLISNSAIRVV